jgi:predicted amidohydrolase
MLKIATCQFEVSKSVEANADWIQKLLIKASKAGADVAHFSECALCGYGGANHQSLIGFDFDNLREQTRRLTKLAGELGIWMVLGSMHELSWPNKPCNCLYIVNSQGQIVERYDKRFCTAGDLEFYSPGNRFVTFDIKGVKCTALICFDLRFPEIYRQVKKLGAQCVFQSFYNAGTGRNVHSHIMRQTMQCHAGTNYLWMSMANTSGPRSPYPSCFIQPDGVIVKQLKLNRSGTRR